MKGRGFMLKRKIERSLGGWGGWGVSKKRTSANMGEGEVSKNHPIYANVIIEWSFNLLFLIKPFFLHDQNVKTKI